MYFPAALWITLPALIANAAPEKHWAFIPPQPVPIPQVKHSAWPRNAIDHFIIGRLEKEGIEPSPQADRVTLIRRLFLDLTGLPPAPDDVHAFLADSDPRAYEHLVDRLLSSPHFGEQWGRHWLDLARYADSDGYEKDGIRPYAYLYRDWVIRAINDDLPFDEFTIDQIAGDLLPNASTAQKVATGFHRQTLTNKEGGVDAEEFRCKAVVDRANTTATVWLGLTLGCAECHNHKYDPISQREYYQFYAFFNNASEKEIPAPTPEQAAEYELARAKWEADLDELKAQWNALKTNDLSQSQAEWEASIRDSVIDWQPLVPESATSANGTTFEIAKDNSITAKGQSPSSDTYIIRTHLLFERAATAFRLEALEPSPGRGAGRARNGNFVLSEFQLNIINADGTERPVSLTNAVADFSQDNYSVTNATDKKKSGWAVSPQTRRSHVAIFEPATAISPGSKLVVRLVQEHGREYTLSKFRLCSTTSAPPFKPLVLSPDVEAVLRISSDSRTPEQAARVARFYREEYDASALQLRDKIGQHFANEPNPGDTKAAVLLESRPPRETFIHVRGDFLRNGDEVEPATLKVLHPFSPRAKNPDRLDLARWLVARENPLTARVAVNRIWNHLFGRGIVSSVADFGTRGESPSHPELLDWLALEFPKLGWSRKALIRLIVTSATYRQSSDYREDLHEHDPQNILLARQNRIRLSAENVRDSHLAVSGLLAQKIGGPSVRPPLPADIAAIGYAGSIKWSESQGADRYRRGLYTFFQRTVPYPMLMTFDAPDSNTTCTRRDRSNTPLQALTLLNDPVFFECAQALANYFGSESSFCQEEKIRHAFEICLSRQPLPEELDRLSKLYDDHAALSSSAAQPDPLLAVCRTLMNLDEFITRQ